MKNSGSTKGISQITVAPKSNKKKDVNVPKNSTLYFQIGLIICLFAAYSLLEMEMRETTYVSEEWPINEVYSEVAINEVRAEKVVPKRPQEAQVQSEKLVDDIKLITEDDPVVETLISPSNAVEEPAVSIDSITVVEEEEEFNIISVQKVPVFPGCEKFSQREDLTKCMSDRIGKLVRKKFDTDIASEQGLSGIQRIMVQFKIDSDGKIKEIKTRAPHPELETEAVRVINKLPQMKPGFQGDKAVPVIYTLPIKFQVKD